MRWVGIALVLLGAVVIVLGIIFLFASTARTALILGVIGLVILAVGVVLIVRTERREERAAL
jgi:uncharacterized membrane protein HdeD (DUF308 family)